MSCVNARSYARNRASRVAKVQAYREANGDVCRARIKAWKAANPEKKRLQDTRRNRRLGMKPAPPHKHEAHVQAWTAFLKVRHDAHVRAWRSDLARIFRWKTRHDTAFCINQRMRNAIKKALRGNKCGRKWETMVGYSLDRLVERLSETIPEGYSLTDIFGGTLHIDHVIPKSLFDVTDPEGLRAAWGLSNLQLLTASDNLMKSNRV